MQPLLSACSITSLLTQNTAFLLYRARHRDSGASVFLKRPAPNQKSPGLAAQLRYEFKLLSEFRELVGVPRVLALDSDDDGLTLILEDRGGEPLADLISQRRIPGLLAALRIGAALARTLDSLHRQGLVHKSLRPQNVLCDPEGNEVWLLDFTLATRLATETTQALHPTAQTPDWAYISPEQTGRTRRMLDHRSDLYSLGVLLYALLTGAPPFTASEPMELIHSHIARRPPPLRGLSGAVPEIVEEIVHKLLAKEAEDRYQTAASVAADLTQCLTLLTEHGRIESFPIGRGDHSGKIHPPQRVYGREHELKELMASLERVSHGATELMLVSGYSGVGKSALVYELRAAVAARSGYFVSGKFEQLNRSAPYESLARALRDLLCHILSESESALSAWRERMQRAVTPNGRLLTNLLPELEFIIGPQPPVPALGPTESLNRFNMVFQALIRAVTTPEHLLVLFLDDLQWVDSASLKLIQSLLIDPERSYLLLIGAYRDNEVDSRHLLTLTLDVLRKTQAPIHELTLRPLDPGSMQGMMSDMLSCEPATVASLSEFIFEQTRGNPLYAAQLLQALYSDQLLWFSAALGTWQWDEQKVRERPVPADIMEFVASQLRRLPARAQMLPASASVIGHTFDFQTLASVSGRPLSEVAADLWVALKEGFVIPVGNEYRFLSSPDEKGLQELASGDLKPWFRFPHDRIQQAAYSMLDESSRRELHHRIGDFFRQQAAESQELTDAQVFDIVKHLNQSTALISDPAEKARLIELNRRAGLRAKASAAYEAAAGYFAVACGLLAQESWDSAYEGCFSLFIERADCECLSNHFDTARELIRQISAKARTTLDHARLCLLEVTMHLKQGQLHEALTAGRRGLVLLGVTLPSAPEQNQAEMGAELQEIQRNLAGREIAALVDAPVNTDQTQLVILHLLSSLTPATFFVDPSLYPVVLLRQVNISLRYGNSDISAFGYGSYGFMLAGIMKQFEAGYEFGRLALALNQRFESKALTCQLHTLFGMAMHYCRPLDEVIANCETGYRAGLESGDFAYLGYSYFICSLVRMSRGEPLSSYLPDVQRFLSFASSVGETNSLGLLRLLKQLADNLQGRTSGRFSLSNEGFDEEQFLRSDQQKIPAYFCRYLGTKLQLFYLYGDYERAHAVAQQAQPLLQSIGGLYESKLVLFYTCLTLLARARTAVEAERASCLSQIEPIKAEIDLWTRSCPENHQHWQLVVEAELAALAGRPATTLYEQALAAARKSSMLRDAAMIGELAAQYELSGGNADAARRLLTEARSGYQRWEASAKVAQLDERYPELIRRNSALQSSAEPATAEAPPDAELPSGMAAVSPELDIAALFQAAQAITSQLALDRLNEQILRTLLSVGGGQRGVLVLVRQDRLVNAASITVDPDYVHVGLAQPLEETKDLPISIVQYVARTRDTVVLDNASAGSRFAGDPYISGHKVKSLLCLALNQGDKTLGILYMENSLVVAAFNPERVQILRLLSWQAAISLQNAFLFNDHQAASQALRKSNEELAAANDRLQQELAERIKAEHERTELQDQIIRMQNARLAELSIPLIPITNEIMVMPLIGTMDSQRAEQVLETALNGAQQHRARTVILDITGLKHVDTAVAKTLGQTASALRLLGTKTVLTGIRAEVAQALVSLGIELANVVTLGTLQSGIAYALRQTSATGSALSDGAIASGSGRSSRSSKDKV